MEMLLSVYLMVIMFTFSAQSSEKKCAYQFDMEDKKVKVSCSPKAVLNIVDQFGNTLLSGETGTQDETPLIFQVNRSSIASVKNEFLKATKKLTDASRLLKKAREELTAQVNKLINLTSLLQLGDDQLKRDLDILRSHELTSPLVREAIIAALQNQYNFLRMGLLAQNTHLNELIRTSMRVTTTVIKTARGARAVGEMLNLRADVMNSTLSNITKLMPGGFKAGAFFGEQTGKYLLNFKVKWRAVFLDTSFAPLREKTLFCCTRTTKTLVRLRINGKTRGTKFLICASCLGVLSSLAIVLLRKRNLVVLLHLCCGCLCFMFIPHGAMGWTAVVSRSYSLCLNIATKLERKAKIRNRYNKRSRTTPDPGTIWESGKNIENTPYQRTKRLALFQHVITRQDLITKTNIIATRNVTNTWRMPPKELV